MKDRSGRLKEQHGLLVTPKERDVLLKHRVALQRLKNAAVALHKEHCLPDPEQRVANLKRCVPSSLRDEVDTARANLLQATKKRKIAGGMLWATKKKNTKRNECSK